MPVVDVNGTSLFYVEVGAGVPCLVMHGGLGFDHSHLRPWVDELGDTLKLVYYDHRGNGRSGRPPLETLTYEQFAADADALREFLEVEAITVMGFSAGGAIALHYALGYPQHLERLILVGTHAAWDYGDEIAERLARKQPSPEMLAAFSAPPPTTDDAYAQMVETIMPLFFHDYSPVASQRFTGDVVWNASAYVRYGELLKAHNVVSRLRDIQVPVLVIVGRDDFITPPSQAQRLAQGLPNAELVIFDDSGHLPYVEETEAFTSVVKDWLAKPHHT